MNRSASTGEAASNNPRKPNRRSVEQDTFDEIIKWTQVLCAEDFDLEQDPDSEEPITLAGLGGEARRTIEQMTKKIDRICSHKQWSTYQKRVACEEIVKVAFQSVEGLFRLARTFPQSFREIAEECSHFPCFFPAQSEELASLKATLCDQLNLGARNTFKLRARRGRKTFSRKTWVNNLLLRLIGLAHDLARAERDSDPDLKYSTALRDVVEHVPLTRENAKEWLDVIWGLLLNGIPNPEMEPRLRQLGNFPSRRKKGMNLFGSVGAKTQATNIRATIKAKLGLYLERMLNEQTKHK